MEEKDTISISNETTPPDKKDIKVEQPKILNYLCNDWDDEWEHHHGDIS